MTSAQGIYISSVTAAFLVTLVMAVVSSEVSTNQFAGVVFIYTLVSSVFATICGFMFGWPLSFLFKRLGFTRWWQYLFGGTACAAPFWFMWFYPFDTGHWEAYRVSNSAYFYSVGAVSGLVYWWLVVRPINKSKQQGRPTSWSAPV
jgi:hypothetical protein